MLKSQDLDKSIVSHYPFSGNALDKIDENRKSTVYGAILTLVNPMKHICLMELMTL